VTPEGRSFLVTGGSSGIGAALARLLAKHGAAAVGIVGRREERLREVLDECAASAPASRMWIGDLDDVAWAERVALEAWEAFGHVDVLVNNAAEPKRRAINVLTNADVEHIMRVNFFSPVRMTLALLPRMLARGEGIVVNVASMGGRLGIAHEAAYCASKFALTGWSESMATDLHQSPIQVRLIQPGPIDTDIWDRPDNDPALFDIEKVPPEEVAEGIVAALASDRFEHYLPDMKAIVTGKDADIDSFIALTGSMIPGIDA
jgi:NAD(P)-dependent dehydrogenase (short-subunit alcohol dehydrogenase family)